MVDLGTGTGLLTIRAARTVSRGRVVVVDASTGRFERLRQNCANIWVSNAETVAACQERLPLDSVIFARPCAAQRFGMEGARGFARAASAGRIKGGFPCMYIWGVK
ncbi:MAG: methyltransferase domain-containing protein [Actinobacteria bacterium]|nr:methyltransferase domain-containing protein [Actinomycetota bacterium]